MVANAICAILTEQTDKPCLFTFASPTKVLGAQLLVETMLVMAACGIKKVSYLTVNSDVEPVINRTARRYIEKVTGMRSYI